MTSRDPGRASGEEPSRSGGDESWFPSLSRNTRDVVTVLSADNTVLYDSPAIGRVFGYAPGERIGKKGFDYVHPDDREAVEGAFARLLAKGPGVDVPLEFRMRRKDGSWRYVEATRTNLLADPDVGGVVVVYRDVTERKRAEAALEESEQKYRTIFENASEGIYQTTPGGRLIEVNPALVRIFGYASAEEMTVTMPDVGRGYVDPERREEFVRLMKEQGTVSGFEYRAYRKDGSVAWISESARAVRGAGGDLLHYEGFLEDVTDRKHAEAALRESEERYRALVEEVPAITYVHHQEPGEASTTEYVSPQVEAVLGYTQEEYASDPTFWETILHPEDRDRILQADRRTSTTEEPFREDFRMIAKDGRAVWLREEGALVRVTADGTEVWHGVMFDVTELKESERRLREAEEGQRRRARELELLHRVRTALSRELNPKGLLRAVVEAVAEVYGYTLVSAYLLEGAGPHRELVLQHQVGYRSVFDRISEGDGVMWRTVRSRRSVLLEDAHADPDFLDATQGIVSEVCVPLLDDREVVGTLNVESTGGLVLTADDLGLMEAVGEHVGVALGRARLHERVREAEERYRALVENIPAVVYMDDADETNSVLYRSPYVREVLGYEPEEFLSNREFWQNLLHPEDRERVLAENARTNQTGEPFRIEYRMIRKDGRAVWLRDEAILIRDDEGRPRYWQGYFVDITERKEAAQALEESEERYRRLVESSPEPIAVHDGREVLYANPAAARLFGAQDPSELVGKEVLGFVHPDDRETVASRVRAVLEEGEGTPLLEEKYLRLDGGVVDAEVAGEPVTYAGKPAVQVILRDISGRKRLEQELRRRATRDPLTGLPNRRFLLERLGHALRRRGNPVALLFLDLDGFKVVNDSLGHEAGDRLLIAAAERIGAAVRPSDTVARLGGDEFVILLENTVREGAERAARRVLAALEAPFAVAEHGLRASASIGITQGGKGRDAGPEDLLREADLAMYRAKERGRSRHEVYEPTMDIRARELLELRSGLLRAVERGEFAMRYQPVVSLEGGGGVVGLEALLRWEHPGGTTVPPAEFLAEAEDAGLSGFLFQHALGEACGLAASLTHSATTSPWLSVNLSPRRLRDDGLVDVIAQALSESGIEAGKLVLEITEDAAVQGGGEAETALGRIRELGARVAIDDFGTGHSSLSHLERLPADFLKLDRAFVAGLEGDSRKPAVVRGMVDLARALGLVVIVEGVETKGQLEILREADCDLVQGHLFAGPLVAEEAAYLFIELD